MKRSVKRPLVESVTQNNGPPENKRSRTEIQVTLVPPTVPSLSRPSSRRRRRRTRQSDPSSQLTPALNSERQVARKRHTPSSSSEDIETDENEIAELSLRLKRARLRTFQFSISTFVEQTVEEESVTVGEEDGNGNNDGTHEASTFTFVLPLAASSALIRRHEYGDGTNCDNHLTHEAGQQAK